MAPSTGNRPVRHLRRYDVTETVRLLDKAGLRHLSVVKIPGPLEKLTMGAVAALRTLLPFAGRQKSFACPPFFAIRRTAGNALARFP